MKTILVYALCSGVLVSGSLAEPKKPSPEGEDGGKGWHSKKRERRGPGGRGRMFKRMDTNQDSLITKEEFFAVAVTEKIPEERRNALFSRLDQNKDGVISKKEIGDMRREQDEKRRKDFRELDIDKSGGLSFEEFSKGKFFAKLPVEKRRKVFERMDSDGDGEVTPKDRPKRPRPPRRER